TNRINKGVQDNEITKHLVIRGLVLLLIEWTLIAWLFSAGFLYFGVLAAIGMGLIVFSFVRKVNTKIILGVSLFLVLDPIFAEFIWNPLFYPGSHPATFSIFNIGHIRDSQLTSWIQAATFLPNWPNGLYSLDPWLGVMGLGVVFGRWLQNQQQLPDSNQQVAKRLAITGGIMLIVFFIVRTFQGMPTSYFSLWVSDGVLIENAFTFQNYFFMSKYPPSIIFLLWTLGGMFLVLALGFYFQEKKNFQKWANPIIVFGTTALFFYCAHLVIYGAIPITLNLVKKFSIQITLLVWILGLFILYPMCIQFRKLKKEYPHSPLKYI
ncbi:MAG: heparan-alpha-glucosaminide N-acetyltransferase domain-containing protein, partial [Candidatus Hodarchaeota archaeon]